MHTRTDIIDGEEVTVKVYKAKPLPKKVTAKFGSQRSNWKRKAKIGREKAEAERFNEMCRKIAADNRASREKLVEPELGCQLSDQN